VEEVWRIESEVRQKDRKRKYTSLPKWNKNNESGTL
jgi:hypothetical protein